MNHELRQHVIQTVEQAEQFLRSRKFGAARLHHLARSVLNDERFRRCPASLSRHQAFEGGLLVHTAQVAILTLDQLATIVEARLDLAFLAALWHDYGKLWDYVETEEGWMKTDHYHQVRHVARSAIEWEKEVEKCWRSGSNLVTITREEVNFVTHMILSHHGRFEWGSPVLPKSTEAMALHHADYLSGRYLEDADYPKLRLKEE